MTAAAVQALLDTAPWSITFDHPDTRTGAQVADWLRLNLSRESAVPPGAADRAGIVARQLVDNAGRHGLGPVRTTINFTPGEIRIAVHDKGGTGHWGADRLGLALVRALTVGDLEITVDRVGRGKTVTALVPYRKEA
jgi:hypothetical protein